MRTSLVMAAVMALWACSDDKLPPLAASGGLGPTVGIGRPDAASSSDEDAGSARDGATDEPMAYECERIEAVQWTDDVVPSVTATSAPDDFRVTRQAATWRDGCDSPTVAIELSDGSCPNGKGHELEILFSARDIQGGVIGVGLLPIVAETDAAAGIRVRYTRPDGLKPAGVWGTCDVATGNISFYEAPDVGRATNLRASYEFELARCDDTTNAPVRVAGYFDVELRRDVNTVCPGF